MFTFYDQALLIVHMHTLARIALDNLLALITPRPSYLSFGVALCWCTSINPCFADSDDSLKRIVLNTTAEAPLSTRDQQGIMDRVAMEAFRRCGYKLVLDKLPAERALRHANKGLIDGELSRIEGIEKTYTNLVRVPEKIYEWHFVAFSKKSYKLTNGWDSLANQNIAFINGWKIYENLTPASATITKTKNERQLFTLLKRDRADIVLYHRAGGSFLIDEMKLLDIKELSPPLAVKKMFIYLNKKHYHLIPALTKAMIDLKSDGTYARIMKSPLLNSSRVNKNE